MSRYDRGPRGRAFLLSTVIHVALAGGMWLIASRSDGLPPMRVYAVNIVSPPPQVRGEPNPDPEPAVEPTEPEPDPVEEPEPEPEPTPPTPPPPSPPERTPPRQEPRPTPPRPEPEPEPEPEPAREPARPPDRSAGARPDPASAGGDDIDVQLPGVQCPTPDYCNNIIRQIHRYFRSPGGGGAGEADVYFVINRNGSIADLRLVSSTGGAGFRLAVMEAVEQAGRNQAFGPLPGAYGADRLPVSFYFRPVR